MITESARSCLRKHSVIAKVFVILFIIFALCFPLSMIRSVLNERQQNRNAAVHDITSSWGAAQTLFGPVLVVPYASPPNGDAATRSSSATEAQPAALSVRGLSYFAPEELFINAQVNSEKRYRGIYEAVVYSGDFTLRGSFSPPVVEGVSENDFLWDEAYLAFPFSDMRGVKESLELVLERANKSEQDKQKFRLEPGSFLSSIPSGAHAKVGTYLKGQSPILFSLRISLAGSESISFIPMGQQTKVELTSNWPDPSFDGVQLPSERKVNERGFTANWQVSHYAAEIPRSWRGKDLPFNLRQKGTESSSFGVKFINPVDPYRSVDRAMKYSVLVMVLTFTAFFLYEVLSSERFHPFQYSLVGAALTIFYLALLSLSEVFSFNQSYLIAASACIGLVIMYVQGFMNSKKGVALISLSLAGTYCFIYVILQLEDYALLAGTIGLFLSLTGVMYSTRKINWYGTANSGSIFDSENVADCRAKHSQLPDVV